MRTTAFTVVGALFAASSLSAPALAQACLGGPDPLEDNDICGSAVPLPGNSQLGLNVEIGDIDFYSVTVPDGQELFVSASHVLASGDIDIYLWDPATPCGTETIDPSTGAPLGEGFVNGSIAQGFTVNEPETLIFPNNSGAALNLVVEVRLWSGDPSGFTCNDYDLDFSLSPINPCFVDALEPSDDCASAPTLSNGITAGLSVTDVNRDYYRINLAAGEEFTASILFSTAVGDIDVHLWDTSVGCDTRVEGEFAATAIQISGSGLDNEYISWVNDSGGPQTLVMEVGIWSGSPSICVPYDLDILQQPSPCGTPDAFESNDDCPSAQPITDGTFMGLNTGLLDRDFYSMTLGDGDTLTVEALFSNADGDIDIYLWDPLIACDSVVVGAGTAANPLALGFSADDNENFTYTNATGAPQDLILEVDTFNPGPFVTCVSYDLVITGLNTTQPGLGTPFCSANNNSTGVVGLCTATGSRFVNDNDVTLRVAQIPALQFGIFVVARAASGTTPVNQGILCLSGPTGRYSMAGQIWQADTGGEASLMINLQAIPTPTTLAGTSPGDTWFFQAWHRDVPPTPGQPGSNFTTGVEISFL